MGLGTETTAIFFVAFIGVIIFSLVIIISMMIKYKSKSYIWFLVQVIMLVAAFFIFLGLIIVNSNTPRKNAIETGIMGLLWTGSMLCMLIGISSLSRKVYKQPVREKEEYNPGFFKGLGMLIFYVLACSLIPELLSIIASKLIGFSQNDPLVYVFTTIAELGLLVLWIRRKYIIDFKSMVSMKNISAILLVPMTISILGLYILLSELDNFIIKIFPMNDFWIKAFNSISGNGFAAWKGILAIAVTGPIVEEIIFRGMILKGFLKHYSVRKSIFLSALLFGLIHMNPWQFFSAFAAGIILGWWYVKTDSIITTIFGHALNNGLCYLISFLSLNIPGFNAFLNSLNHQTLWLDIFGFILLASGIIWLIKLFSKRQSKEITING